MVTPARRRAVILYDHALLGEGLAARLRLESNVDVVLACVRDRDAVLAALQPAPHVVIFERSGTLCDLDLAALAPQAVLVDVSTAVGRGAVYPSTCGGFELILQALRDAHIPAPARSPECRSGVTAS